jgi:hypothetical protein
MGRDRLMPGPDPDIRSLYCLDDTKDLKESLT